MAVSIRDAMLVYRTLSYNGSVLAFCEAVSWQSAFATRCWFTAFSVVMGLVCELVRGTGVGAADLIGSCASGRLGRPLGGPRGLGGPGGPLNPKMVNF